MLLDAAPINQCKDIHVLHMCTACDAWPARTNITSVVSAAEHPSVAALHCCFPCLRVCLSCVARQGVQQARNAMTACTYLATISVALATAGITIIFDDNRMQRIQ
jgi:hypothetical protein